MNKTQLIDELSSRFEGNKKAAGQALEAVVDTITRTVAKGEKVAITGFGVFEKIDKPARFARNPATGERVRVKKTSVPRFKAGTGFKDVVSGAKKLPKLTTTKAAERGRSAATTAKQGAGKVTAAGRAAAGTARERVATATKKGPAAKSSASSATAKKASGGAAAKKAAAPKTTATKTTAARKTTSSTRAKASASKTVES